MEVWHFCLSSKEMNWSHSLSSKQAFFFPLCAVIASWSILMKLGNLNWIKPGLGQPTPKVNWEFPLPVPTHGSCMGDGTSDWDQSCLKLNANVLKIWNKCHALFWQCISMLGSLEIEWGSFPITPGRRPLGRRHNCSYYTHHVAPGLKRELHVLNENKATF